jgi:type I restriction enzyme, S subunit
MSVSSVRLGDVLSFLPKSSLKAANGSLTGQFPFFTSSADQSKWTNDPTFDTEALVFATGGAAAVHYVKGPFAASGDCLVVEPRPETSVHLRYWYHYLQWNLRALEAGFHGAGLRHVSKRFIEDLALPQVPLEVQRRTTAVLDRTLSLRARRQASIDLLGSLTQGFLLSLIGRDYDGRVASLAEITTRVTDGTHQTPKFRDAGVPFIFVKNVRNGSIDFRTDKFISRDEHAALYRRCPVEPGDVLYTTVGATYGHAAAVGSFTDFAFQRHIAHIKPDPSKVLPDYLAPVMQLPLVKVQADRWARGAAQPTINLKELREFQIPLPSLAVQREFAERAARIDHLRTHKRKSIDLLSELRQALAATAFATER